MKQERKNRNIAFAYFQAIGMIPKNAGKNEWHLHHKDVNLKYNDRKRYDEWRIEDLVPMLAHCHRALHSRNRHVSDETKNKLSESLKGHEVSQETRMKISESVKRSESHARWVKSEENRKRVSEQMKLRHAMTPKKVKVKKERGKFWITNGLEDKRIADLKDIPDGWRIGRMGGWKRKHNPKLGPMTDEHKRKISESKRGIKK